jgi:methylenetetrahydrofolate dehydrogenase (NADP+)/methenyltetrahydrofolate cyclohydrolase
MKTIIFDGRKFAAEKEVTLSNRVLGLKTREVYPKLASILVGKDPASQLYINLKKKAAERIGAEVDIYLINENSKPEDLILLIKTLNVDKNVHGIMIQMPIPGKMGNLKDTIVSSIKPEKDVDGLRVDSPFLHPTSKAVMEIIEEAKKAIPLKSNPCKVVVIGATGMVGTPLVRELKKENYEVTECNTKTSNLKKETSQSDILVSATGVPNIINGDMVKNGTIIIDVGSPKGDIEFVSVSAKSSFITSVPGGVGPVTISCLLENLVSAC